MPRLIGTLLLLLLTIGCASPGRTTTLVREGDYLQRRGDRAMSAGMPEQAASDYATSYRLYLESQGMARWLLQRSKRPDPRLITCEWNATDALPKTALKAAEAHSEIAIRRWRRGDESFDKWRLWDAISLYREAWKAYGTEHRWLVEARRRLEAIVKSGREIPRLQEQKEAIDSDLAQVARDRDALQENIRRALLRLQQAGAFSPHIGEAILDGLLVGAEAIGLVLEQVGLAVLTILSEPVFWEICFDIITIALRD